MWNVTLAKVNQVETLMFIPTNGNEEAEKSFLKIKEKKRNSDKWHLKYFIQTDIMLNQNFWFV